MHNLNIKTDKGLFVNYKGRDVIEHCEGRAFVTLSKSLTDYKIHKRNVASYRIKNKIIDKYIPKAITKVVHNDNIVSITLDNIVELVFTEIDNRLNVDIILNDKDNYNSCLLSFKGDRDEAIYGCGQQFSYLNLKGRKVPLWTQEPGFAKNRSIYKYVGDLVMGAGGEWWTNYYPQALIVSSNNYYILVESYAYSVVNLSNDNYHSFFVNEVPRKIVIDVNCKATDMFQSLTNYLKRQRPLPDWIMDGVILGIGGGLDGDNNNSLPAKLDSALKAGAKVSAIWAEDWTGLRHFKAQTRLYWNWEYNKKMYSGLPEYIKHLREGNIRFLGYNNCFLMNDSEMYKQAKERGYLVNDYCDIPYELNMFTLSAAMLDLTNPQCCEWYKKIVKDKMIGIGLSGWMCDFGEYLPADSKLYTGVDARIHHNEYPVLWAKVNEDAIREMQRDFGEDAIVFFSRSGNLGTTTNSPLIWSGDQVMTYWKDSGLPAAINSSISMGFSGVGYYHSDIGGEFGILWFRRSKDLFIRWTEFAAFTPVMRTHEAKGNSGWTYDTDEETLRHFAKMTKIHSKMLPYLRAVSDEYQTKGLPMMRHPYIHYEDDKYLHSKKPRLLQYQYLLGRDLLIAPIIQKNVNKRKLYLPKDEWVHIWSGQIYTGGWIEVSAPYGEPPVFVRKKSQYYDIFMSLRNE